MKIGTKLPTLKGQTTQGDITLPDDYSRQWISISPPADFTPVCTTEFVAFQSQFKSFKN